jgi:hypothetical protein
MASSEACAAGILAMLFFARFVIDTLNIWFKYTKKFGSRKEFRPQQTANTSPRSADIYRLNQNWPEFPEFPECRNPHCIPRRT